MSGFEIFGAVGTSLALTRHIIDTLRWAKKEHDLWKRAPQELKELLVSATSTQICFDQIKLKLESIVVQVTLEQYEPWRRYAILTLEASEGLLSEVQAYLPPEMEKRTFFKKLKASFNAEKTTNFTSRLNNLTTQLNQLYHSPPL